MLNKNERMEKLNNAGVNTSKYFTVDLDNGTTIHLIIDENGNPKVVDNKENDPILEEIITDGYVRNTKLYRRFVMAQMFQMLNYVSYDGHYRGYTDCLNRGGSGLYHLCSGVLYVQAGICLWKHGICLCHWNPDVCGNFYFDNIVNAFSKIK